MSVAGGVLSDRPATRVTRQIVNLASEAGLNPHLDPSGVRHGSYTVIVDPGSRRDCLFGGIDVGARTGRILHAHRSVERCERAARAGQNFSTYSAQPAAYGRPGLHSAA